MTPLHIAGGDALLPEGFARTGLVLADGRIARIGASAGNADAMAVLDASGLLVLPGIVDVHGDAHERGMQPRPGVGFPMAVAVADTEAQLLANGITTAFLGVTLSWEPGLRGLPAWRALLDALDEARPRLSCDLRVHMRWEAFNLDALDDALADIRAGRVHMLGLNDHTPAILRRLAEPAAAAKYSERAQVSPAEFRAVAERAGGRGAEVAAARAELVAAAVRAGLPMASHDDATVAERDEARALGAAICEFPTTEAVGRAARAAGDAVVMGCPNVVRGGSHLGWASAAALAEAGVCDVLCSDYFFPAMPRAPLVLAGRGVLDLADAWALVSTNPARAAGLADRGRLAEGLRGDVVVLDPAGPHVVATVAGGRVAHLSAQGWNRLHRAAGR